MNDLIDEVSADLEEEKTRAFIQKAIKCFATLAIIVVVGAIFYAWKDKSVKHLQGKLGEWYAESISLAESNQLEEALRYLDKIIEHSHQQYAALAYLNKSAILIKQSKFEEAQNTLLELSKQKHFDQALRELAQLTYLSNMLNNNQAASYPNLDLLSKLVQDNKPWQISSLQLKTLYDIKQGNIEDAKSNLDLILKSKKATKSSYDIASSILASISKSE